MNSTTTTCRCGRPSRVVRMPADRPLVVDAEPVPEGCEVLLSGMPVAVDSHGYARAIHRVDERMLHEQLHVVHPITCQEG